MLVLPGPAFLFLAGGLSLLAREFGWAERLRLRVTTRNERGRLSSHLSPRGVLVLCTAVDALVVSGTVSASLIGGVPLLPF
jgi:hypothetical protein